VSFSNLQKVIISFIPVFLITDINVYITVTKKLIMATKKNAKPAAKKAAPKKAAKKAAKKVVKKAAPKKAAKKAAKKAPLKIALIKPVVPRS
jgi:hypothetical protein